jgi:hypothetical protein
MPRRTLARHLPAVGEIGGDNKFFPQTKDGSMRVMICLLLLLSACSTPVVRCDKHLEAINAPAPKIAADANRSLP